MTILQKRDVLISFFIILALIQGGLVSADTQRLSLNSDEASTNQEIVTLARAGIQQKALDVAKQVEIYLVSNPQKNVTELQADEYFKGIAVQRVGQTGYTTIMNADTLVNYFHQNEFFVGTNYHSYKDTRPSFFSILEQAQGCKDSEGVYEWREPDNSINLKYAYYTCVSVPTGEGITLRVGATSYLSDYEHNTSRTTPRSLFSPDHLKQSAQLIAKQAEIYLRSNPQMTVQELRDDEYFRQIAIQPIGVDGYTVLFDYDSMINVLHHSNEYEGIDYNQLRHTSPSFWEIAKKVKGGEHKESEGYYVWIEPDGSSREKYMYITIIPLRTLDGVGLAVSTTIYIDEYDHQNIVSMSEFEVLSYEQLTIQLKALQAAQEINAYLIAHPQASLMDLQQDNHFWDLAVQRVGKTGYTAVVDVNTGVFSFHPQERLIGTQAELLKDKLPDWWSILERTIGEDCTESKGEYEWIEADGSKNTKFMYLACVKTKTADNKSFFVAATTYTDEITAAKYLSRYGVTQERVTLSKQELLTRFEFWSENMNKRFYMAQNMISPDTFAIEILEKSNIENLENFNKQFGMIEGAWRTNKKYYKETYGQIDIAGTMLYSNYPLTPDIKQEMIAFQRYTKIYADATKQYFVNRYFTFEKGYFSMYPDEWVYESGHDNKFKEEMWYYIADPQHNPEKKSLWTYAYYDAVIGEWMVSLITPIYHDEEFIGTSGGDILLREVFEEIEKTNYQGLGVAILFDDDKNIIAHPKYSEKITQKGEMEELFSINDIEEQELKRLLQRITDTEGEVLFVENNTEQLLIYKKLDNIDWYYGFLIKADHIGMFNEDRSISTNNSDSQTKRMQSVEINYTFLISTLIVLLLFLYMSLSSDVAHKKSAHNYYKTIVFLGLLMTLLLFFSRTILSEELIIHTERLLHLSAFIMLLEVLILSFYLANKKLGIVVKRIGVVGSILVGGTYLFTNKIIEDVSFIEGTKNIMYISGDWFLITTMFQLVFIILAGINIYTTSKHIKRASLIILIALGSILLGNVIFYLLLQEHNIYLLIFSLPVFCFSIHYSLLRMGYIHNSKNKRFILIGGALFLIILLFSYASINSTQKLKETTLESRIQINSQVMEQDVTIITREIHYLFDDLRNLRDRIAKEEADGEVVGRELEQSFQRAKRTVYGSYRINSSGYIVNMYPVDEASMGADISEQEHMRLVERTRQEVISDSFQAVEGFTGITLHVPVIRDGMYDGTVAYLMTMDSLTSLFLSGAQDALHDIYLIDAQGVIMYSDKNEMVGSIFDDELHSKEDLLVMIQPFMVGDKEWTLLTVEDKQEILEDINKEIRFQNSLIIFIVIAILSLGILFNHFMTKTLRSEVEEKTSQVQKHFKDLNNTKLSLINMMEDLEQANSNLKELDEAKSNFLNIVSHELKTPLTAMLAHIDVIKESGKRLSKQQIKSLDSIKRNASALRMLIENILEIARIESNKFVLNTEAVEITEVVSNAYQNLKVLAERKGLRMLLKQEKMIIVHTDPIRLKEILNNLISNAIKFTDKGSITILVRKETNYVRISVEDTGRGIPKDKIKNLFQKFYQVEPSLSRSYGGTGLGLSITKQLVELQGGSTSVRSVEGEGTTFSFTLPIKKHNKK